MGEWKCNQEVIMCSIKVVQTSFCTKPKPSFNGNAVSYDDALNLSHDLFALVMRCTSLYIWKLKAWCAIKCKTNKTCGWLHGWVWYSVGSLIVLRARVICYIYYTVSTIIVLFSVWLQYFIILRGDEYMYLCIWWRHLLDGNLTEHLLALYCVSRTMHIYARTSMQDPDTILNIPIIVADLDSCIYLMPFHTHFKQCYYINNLLNVLKATGWDKCQIYGDVIAHLPLSLYLQVLDSFLSALSTTDDIGIILMRVVLYAAPLCSMIWCAWWRHLSGGVGTNLYLTVICFGRLAHMCARTLVYSPCSFVVVLISGTYVCHLVVTLHTITLIEHLYCISMDSCSLGQTLWIVFSRFNVRFEAILLVMVMFLCRQSRDMIPLIYYEIFDADYYIYYPTVYDE